MKNDKIPETELNPSGLSMAAESVINRILSEQFTHKYLLLLIRSKYFTHNIPVHCLAHISLMISLC